MFVDNTSSSTNESVSDFIETSNGSYVLLLSSIIRLEQLWIFLLYSFLWAFATRFKANVLICLSQSETVERVNLDLLINSDATLDFELHMSFLAFELNTKVFYSLLTSIDPKCGIKLKINSSSMYMAFMTLTTFDKYFNISR